VRIELGMFVSDVITGIEGYVMGRTTYLTGCIQCAISRPVKENGEIPDWFWTDESRLLPLKKEPVKLFIQEAEPAGPQFSTPPEM
jgi:hypothetical protein